MAVLLGISLTATVALAQTSDAAAPSAPKPAQSAAPEKPPDPAKEFARIEKYVQKRGSTTLLAGYICATLGLTRPTNQGEMGQLLSTAFVSDLDSSRVAYLLDHGEIILTAKAGDNLTIYLADKKGRLEKAAMSRKSRGSITMMSLALAAQGFQVEKQFWTREVDLNSEEDTGAGR
jgi:hypothetical protein